MTTSQLVHKNNRLVQAFRLFKKRYLATGKKPNFKKFLPDILYRTMRLEGEEITKKEAQALFR